MAQAAILNTRAISIVTFLTSIFVISLAQHNVTVYNTNSSIQVCLSNFANYV
jgi:hypothetical protein